MKKQIRGTLLFIVMVSITTIGIIQVNIHMDKIIPDAQGRIKSFMVSEEEKEESSIIEEKINAILENTTAQSNSKVKENEIEDSTINKIIQLLKLEEEKQKLMQNAHKVRLQDKNKNEIYYFVSYAKQIGQIQMMYTTDEKNIICVYTNSYEVDGYVYENPKIEIDEEKRKKIVEKIQPILKSVFAKEFNPTSIWVSETQFSCILQEKENNIIVNYHLGEDEITGFSIGF